MISFNMLMDTLFNKTSFIHNFLKKRRNFFTIFKQNDTIFSQFSIATTQFFHNWSSTGPLYNFGKKTLQAIGHGLNAYLPGAAVDFR